VSHYRRSPRSLDEAFASLTAEWAPATTLAAIQRAWPGTVGELIAAEAQPTAERGGVLTIACSASVWAQELDLMSAQIIPRLNLALERDLVKRLRCVATGFSDRPSR
jgi:predicted nucleic acid-binding Zn ribbon protein